MQGVQRRRITEKFDTFRQIKLLSHLCESLHYFQVTSYGDLKVFTFLHRRTKCVTTEWGVDELAFTELIQFYEIIELLNKN